MKNTKMYLAILALCTISLLSSCTKEDKKVADKKPEDKNLIIGSWKCTSLRGDKPLGYDTAGVPAYDYYEGYALPDCRKDDLLIFNESGTYDIDEGLSKCNSSDPQIIKSGIWAIVGDSLKLTIGGEANFSSIIQLDKTVLKLQSSGPSVRIYADGTIDTVYANLVTTGTYQRQ